MTSTAPMPKPREHGRPPADPATSRFWETDFHKLLAESLAPLEGMVEDGRIVPAKLAKACGCCRYTAYRWLGGNRISPKGARRIIEISEGRLTKEDFAPFLIL